MRLQGLGHEEQARRVLVDPVNYAGPGNLLQLRRMVQQAIHERPTGIPGARVHDQPRGLVHHQQVVILVYDVQPNRLRSRPDFTFHPRLQRDGFPTGDGVARSLLTAIDSDRASQQPFFQAASGIFGKHPGKCLVQTETSQLLGDRHYLFFGVHDYAGVYGILADLERPTARFMRIDRHKIRLLMIAILPLALFACASDKEQRTEVQNITEAYETAKESVKNGNYRRGIQIFEAIQARFPFSDLSRQIQLELMYAYYKGGQREEAVEAADTFMRENPIHARVDYALYIKGLAHFEEPPGVLERMFRKDVSQRPPRDVEQAYSSLRRLVERFPASQYAPDAQLRMIAIKNRLADYENYVADYYLRRGAYVAALRRAKDALEAYNGATGNARSLQIMAAAYDNLGMADLAADTRRVLAESFPEFSADG